MDGGIADYELLHRLTSVERVVLRSLTEARRRAAAPLGDHEGLHAALCATETRCRAEAAEPSDQ